MFFDEKEYTIKPIKNLVYHDNNETYETVKMIQYDVTNKKKILILQFYQLKEQL